MNTLLKIIIVVNLILLFPALPAAEQPLPRLEPSVYILQYRAKPAVLTLDDFINLSLYVSGVEEARIPDFRESFTAAIMVLKTATAGMPSSARLSEKILDFMHSNYLKNYQEKETRLDVLLTEGIFNCVSSSVFYLILAQALGLPTWGIRTIDHAFCRVSTAEGEYDVETTNQFGFDPGSKKQFTDDFGNITGFNYVPPGNYQDRRNIDALHLIALILQNRVTFLSEKRLFSEAAELAVDYQALLQDAEAYEVLINAFLNMWAVFNKAGAFTAGLAFYDQVITRFGPDPRLIDTRKNLTHNYLLTTIDENQLTAARQILDERRTLEAIPEEDFHKFHLYIISKEVQAVAAESYTDAINLINAALITHGQDTDLLKLKDSYVYNAIIGLIQANQPDQAYTIAAGYRASGDLQEREWKQLLVHIYQKMAYAYKDDFLKAAKILRRGIEEAGEVAELVAQYQAFLHNYEVTMHNKMVALYNTGDLTQAKVILQEALKEVPGSQRLQEDLQLILSRLEG